MKTVVFAPAALDRLADILAWSVERFGEGPETLQVVEIFHQRMNIEAHLERLVEQEPS